MSSDPVQSGVVSITAPAPFEANVARSHPFTHIIYLELKKDEFSGTLDNMLANYLTGCGNVQLVKLSVVFQPPSEGVSIAAGVCEAGANVSIDLMAMKGNGILFTSALPTVGRKFTEELVPEDTLSKQIRPISSDLPMIKVCVRKDTKMKAMLEVRLKVNGMIQLYGSLN